MEGRSALIAAIVSGALAVAIVAVDLQFGLEAELQHKVDGEWVGQDKESLYEERGPGLGCGGQDVRLHVHNNGLLSTTLPVSITYHTLNGERVVELDAEWTLERGAIEVRSFRIPDEAFVHDNAEQSGLKFTEPSISVSATVGDIYLHTCVVQEAAE